MVNTITGTSGRDSLVGTSDDDLILGLAGNDTLQAAGGTDTLNGGGGQDRLIGDPEGATTAITEVNFYYARFDWRNPDLLQISGDPNTYGDVTGDTYADISTYVFEDETLTAEELSVTQGSWSSTPDAVPYESGIWTYDGGSAANLVHTYSMNTTVMHGQAGDDRLYTSSADDQLSGNAGADRLFGRVGDDFLNGGYGWDSLTGGADADTFYHGLDTHHGTDWILDYNATDGDVLQFAGAAATGEPAATADDFILHSANTRNRGDRDIDEVFVEYVPTGQIVFALQDGAAQDHVSILIGTDTFELMI